MKVRVRISADETRLINNVTVITLFDEHQTLSPDNEPMARLDIQNGVFFFEVRQLVDIQQDNPVGDPPGGTLYTSTSDGTWDDLMHSIPAEPNAESGAVADAHLENLSELIHNQLLDSFHANTAEPDWTLNDFQAWVNEMMKSDSGTYIFCRNCQTILSLTEGQFVFKGNECPNCGEHQWDTFYALEIFNARLDSPDEFSPEACPDFDAVTPGVEPVQAPPPLRKIILKDRGDAPVQN